MGYNAYNKLTNKNLGILTLVALSFFIFFISIPAQATGYKMLGYDRGNTRNPPEQIISPENVGSLQVKAGFPVDAMGPIIKDPVVDDDAIYFVDLSGNLYKIDKNGNTLWEPKPLYLIAKTCVPPGVGEHLGTDFIFGTETAPTLHGDQIILATTLEPINFSYFIDPIFDEVGEIVGYDAGQYFQDNPKGVSFVVSIDKNSGVCNWATRASENPFEEVLPSGTVHNNTYYTGISSYEESLIADLPIQNYIPTTVGRAVAIDLITGQRVWYDDENDVSYEPKMIDPQGDPNDPSDDLTAEDLAGYSGATIWSSAPVVSPSEKLVIYTTGNDYYAGPNISPTELNLFHNSVNAFVAVDIKTGQKKWVTSVVPEDFWNLLCAYSGNQFGVGGDPIETECGPDFDFGAGATLMANVPNDLQMEVNGKIPQNIDMVAAVNKKGYVYGVEIETGQLAWSTQVSPETLTGLNGTAYDEENKILIATSANLDAYGNLPDGTFGQLPQDWTLVNPGTLLGGIPWENDTIYGGTVSALDPATGEIIWQNAPQAAACPIPFPDSFISGILAPPTVANGVVYAGAVNLPVNVFGIDCPGTDQNMMGYDVFTGDQIWGYEAIDYNSTIGVPYGFIMIAGATPVDGVLYWGTTSFDLVNFSYGAGQFFAFEPAQP